MDEGNTDPQLWPHKDHDLFGCIKITSIALLCRNDRSQSQTHSMLIQQKQCAAPMNMASALHCMGGRVCASLCVRPHVHSCVRACVCICLCECS